MTIAGPALRRFWFVLEQSPSPLGYGVTAHDEADAADVLQRLVFPTADLPRVVTLRSDVTVPDLDQVM